MAANEEPDGVVMEILWMLLDPVWQLGARIIDWGVPGLGAATGNPMQSLPQIWVLSVCVDLPSPIGFCAPVFLWQLFWIGRRASFAEGRLR